MERNCLSKWEYNSSVCTHSSHCVAWNICRLSLCSANRILWVTASQARHWRQPARTASRDCCRTSCTSTSTHRIPGLLPHFNQHAPHSGTADTKPGLNCYLESSGCKSKDDKTHVYERRHLSIVRMRKWPLDGRDACRAWAIMTRLCESTIEWWRLKEHHYNLYIDRQQMSKKAFYDEHWSSCCGRNQRSIANWLSVYRSLLPLRVCFFLLYFTSLWLMTTDVLPQKTNSVRQYIIHISREWEHFNDLRVLFIITHAKSLYEWTWKRQCYTKVTSTARTCRGAFVGCRAATLL